MRVKSRSSSLLRRATESCSPSQHIAFILDPDQYWIEIVPNKPFKM